MQYWWLSLWSHDFSILASLTYEATGFFTVQAVLCAVRWWAAPRGATHEWVLLSPPSIVSVQNTFTEGHLPRKLFEGYMLAQGQQPLCVHQNFESKLHPCVLRKAISIPLHSITSSSSFPPPFSSSSPLHHFLPPFPLPLSLFLFPGLFFLLLL